MSGVTVDEGALAARPGPASIVALGATSCGAVAWRVRGQLRLTVLVKATFALVPGAAMTPAPPDELIRAEVHHGNAPTQSVRLTTDLAPFLPAADALLTGRAHAPEGAPAQALTVRFAIFRERALMEKVVHVYGDRAGAAQPGREGAELTPFEQMPLVYERAHGGLGARDNPFGTGIGASDKPPNLVDPADATRPACFAPLSAAWPSRRRLLERPQLEGLKQPIIEIVGELDWQYFHAAPPDQRIAHYLKGNEWVVLDGMHPRERSVQSRLPDVAGAARVYGLGGGTPESTADGGRDVVLVADTLRVDADRMTCSVVWRGNLPVPDEATLAALEVVGGVSLGDARIEWPARLEEDVLVEYESLSEAAPQTAPPSPRRAPQVQGTMRLDGTLSLGPEAEIAPADPLPFARGPALILPRTAPRAPARDVGSTLTITPEDEGAARARAPVPFAAPFAAVAIRQATPPSTPPTAVTSLTSVTSVTSVTSMEAPNPPRAQAPRRAERRALGMDLFPDPSLALEVVPWGLTPARDVVTVVAGATCDLIAGGPAVPRPQPRELASLAPFKVRADVVLVGHAIAPGASATSMEVAFRFGAGDNAFARTVIVSGDRVWERVRGALQPSAPASFARLPLAFEHAFGGPRFAANPAGVGHHDPRRRGPVPLPNLEDPEHLLRSPRQTPEPAVFAPIPLAWKDRWAASGESPLSLPEALDWTRFQAAPRPQQLAFLAGDEPFAIAGVSARYPLLEGALPGLRARAFASWGTESSARFEEVTMRLDTVVFDTDAMTLGLVWRGALALADEQRPEVKALYLLADGMRAETSLADARVKLLRP